MYVFKQINGNSTRSFSEEQMKDKLHGRLLGMIGKHNNVEVKEIYVTSAVVSINGRLCTADFVMLFPSFEIEWDQTGEEPKSRMEKIMGDGMSGNFM